MRNAVSSATTRRMVATGGRLLCDSGSMRVIIAQRAHQSTQRTRTPGQRWGWRLWAIPATVRAWADDNPTISTSRPPRWGWSAPLVVNWSDSAPWSTVARFSSKCASLSSSIESSSSGCVAVAAACGTIEGRLFAGNPADWPASHYAIGKEKRLRALKTIREELLERLQYLRDNDLLLEAQRLEQRTLYDLEMLEVAGSCKGTDHINRSMR